MGIQPVLMTTIPGAMRLPFSFGLSGTLHVAVLSGWMSSQPYPAVSISGPPLQVRLARGASGANVPRPPAAPGLRPARAQSRHTPVDPPIIEHELPAPAQALSTRTRGLTNAGSPAVRAEHAPLHIATAIMSLPSEVSKAQTRNTEPSIPDVDAAVINTTVIDAANSSSRTVMDATHSTSGNDQGRLSSEPDGTLNAPLKVPRALYSPLHKYPEEARWEGRTGRGSLGFRLLPDGSVDPEIKVLRSSGHADLDATAVESLRHWRFALPPGAAPSSWYRYPFRFGIS